MKTIKKIFAAAVLFVATTFSATAQMIDKVDLEEFAKQEYGTNWKKAAEASNQTLDNQGNIVLTKQISAPGMSQNDLYNEMTNWFICNYGNAIQYADKQDGVIIARPFLQDIARSAGGMNAYNISICPTVRAQVLDGMVNVTYTLHDYNVVTEQGGGVTAGALKLGAATAAIAATTAAAVHDARRPHTTVVSHYDRGFGYRHSTVVVREYIPRHTFEAAVLASCIAETAMQAPSEKYETWTLNNCFPFTSHDSHKKASSKALIMSNVYSQVVMNNIEAALRQCKQLYHIG